MSPPDLETEFARDGFALLRGAVPADRVAEARAAIRESLAADTRAGRAPRMRDGNYCPDLTGHPAILAVLDPLRESARRLFGERAQDPRGGERAQIALRFPDAAPSGIPDFGFHLDGYPTAQNGVPSGRIHRATLLVGVYLTEVSGPNEGNFVVWPGSHRRFARFFRELDAPRFLEAHGAEALLARICAFDAGAPRQLEVHPGDAILAHHLLGHGVSDNLGERTREAVYFRLLHDGDRASDPTPLLDERRFFETLPFQASVG
jgi:hypothetical protein